ncbi:MAG TPA: ATP-binding protein [Longimicrobiales bacterium]|nr:ATP-binding protein [Longimicrobiales bacterium]
MSPSASSFQTITIAPDGAVEVHVSDTGPGFAPEDQQRIFEPFWRDPGTDSGGGTGLGLNVARNQARLVGGDITLESSEDGSTFTLTLPGDATAPVPGVFRPQPPLSPGV